MDFDAKYNFTSKDRFLEYVKIDTQSDAASKTQPSTAKQKDLARVLVQELLEMGIEDAHLDQHGYVYATVPASVERETVPVICFCAHMDTSPDSSGTNVKPIVHKNYQGEDIVLPDDPTIIIKMAEHPDLKDQIGNDIITASGTTLLGADNKAGVAAIMDAVKYWTSHPDAEHGIIKILFTPDEEIGRGVEKVDLTKLGAKYGYTIDGESLGSIENETFSADAAILTVEGVSAHPGFGKGKLVSAIKMLSDIISALPKDELSPETTEGMQGFIHPVSIKGTIEKAEAQFILRDFETEVLKDYAQLIEDTASAVSAHYPGGSYSLQIIEQYRNMAEVLQHHPSVTEFAVKAIEEAGIKPKLQSIRGGTDGSRLSFMGLPCPNIFAGEHAFHSKQEWVSVQDMQKSTEVIVRLASIWVREV